MKHDKCKHCGAGLMKLLKAELVIQQFPADKYPEARRITIYECDVCNVRDALAVPVTHEFVMKELAELLDRGEK